MDKEILKLIDAYKTHIRKSKLENERYKWELVNQFKGRPNLNVTDFSNEIQELDFANLVYAMSNSVRKHLAEQKPEELKTCFIHLFDEEVPLSSRVVQFSKDTLSLYKEIDGKHGHHQDERTISAYLTYHNPDKYTFYKNSFYQAYCKLLGVKTAPKNKKYAHYLDLLNDLISVYIQKDEELIDLVKSLLPRLYDGENHLLLAQDILYTMLENEVGESDFSSNERNYWIYAPGEKAKYWAEYAEKGVIGLGWNDLGDIAKYKNKDEIVNQLQILQNTKSSKKNDATANWDFVNRMKIGDIIIVRKGNSKLLGYGEVVSDYYWEKENEGQTHFRKVKWIKTGLWKVDHTLVIKTLTIITDYKSSRDEFDYYYEQLLNVMNTGGTKNNLPQQALNEILYGPPGTGKTFYLKSTLFPIYTTKESAITRNEFLLSVINDLSWWKVIALVLKDLELGKVNEIRNHEYIKAKEVLSSSSTVKQTIWGQLQAHTSDDCKNVGVSKKSEPLIFYKNDDSTWILDDVGFEQIEEEISQVYDSIRNFEVKEGKELKRFDFVTFHQSYTYEDFIEGIKPVMNEDFEGELKYEIQDGIFKKMCQKASGDPENRYALFIDEINRGNVSAIFGELITLIEQDKRKGESNELSTTLPYSRKSFSVPSNLDIYGTMNTADRSVEALDTALRRRFSFKEVGPDAGLIEKVGKADKGEVDGIELVPLLETINKRIEVLLDKDHCIGHSYFLKVKTLEDLKQAFVNKIIPLLQEYFFGDYGKIGLVLGKDFVKQKKKGANIFASFEEYDASMFEDRIVYTIEIPKNFKEAIRTLLNN